LTHLLEIDDSAEAGHEEDESVAGDEVVHDNAFEDLQAGQDLCVPALATIVMFNK
jgi:hypothetical protein